MSAPSQTVWFALFVLLFGGLLFVWMAGGLIAVLVIAAGSDLVLSAAEHRHRMTQSRTKLSDQ